MTMTIGLCLNTHHSLRSKSTNIYQDVRRVVYHQDFHD